MKHVKRVPAYVLAAVFFLAGTAKAQISFGVSNNGTNTYVIDTRGQGAFIVRLAAIPAASGVSTCTVQIDGSSDNVNFGSGDVLIGVGCTSRGGFISGITGANWIRLNITQTGTGNVQFNVNVEKATSLSSGTAAAGSAVSGNPVLVAGSDGFVRTIRTDSLGGIAPSLSVPVALTDGQGNSESTWGVGGSFPFFFNMFLNFNGSTWDRVFYCPNSATFSVANTVTQVVALSGTTRIRICSAVLSGNATAGTMDIVSGTGTNCATGTTTLSGTLNVLGTTAPPVNLGLSSTGPLIAPSGTAVCVRAVTTTASGFITFVQY